MKKTVIAIWGNSNYGKTSTIKEFYRQLKSSYPAIKKNHSNNAGGDIQKILELNGIKIGIESQGDPNSRIFESLPLFSKQKCDIIICATRTRGSTVGEVKKLKMEGYEVIWFSNLVSWQKDKDKLNVESAQFLLHIFEQVLNGVY